MKSYLHTLACMLLLAASATVITACSSDDDETNFPTPQYENVSAYYEVTSGGGLKSVELTASGNYIVIKNETKTRRVFSFSRFIVAPDEDETRATTYNNIIKGKFTKISDTEFELEGFGRIVITGSADNAMSLEITPAGGETYTLEAAKKTQTPDSQKTSWMCRTWNIWGFGMKMEMSYGGKTAIVMDGRYAIDDEQTLKKDVADGMKNMYSTLFPEEYERNREDADASAEEMAESINLFKDNKPQQAIFTKAGTYMVVYENEKLAVATWAWDDEEKGIMRYSWDYSNMGKDKGSWSATYGTVGVSFNGSQMLMKEERVLDESNQYLNGLSATVSLSWIFEEGR